MLGITDYWAFIVAVLVFLALPGPGTLALLTATGKGGFRAGAAATLGLIAGDQVLMWLAALGVAAVLQGLPVLFKALQYAGAAYIVFIGLRLMFARGGGAQPVRMHTGHYLRQALWITLLNPKAIVFYMAFFPLFIDPQSQQGAITFAAMAVTIAALTLAYCLTLVACAHVVTAQVKAHRGLARALERLAGLVLVAFGIKLVQ
ncbi:MAG TPA: LysE family transporter [Burkholderiaceae bacterium]|nr:LysE family transporter [Burkholderiaceae bacterium]HQR71773.1 LysE family transporter [Burkholderiaceae bacterium]